MQQCWPRGLGIATPQRQTSLDFHKMVREPQQVGRSEDKFPSVGLFVRKDTIMRKSLLLGLLAALCSETAYSPIVNADVFQSRNPLPNITTGDPSIVAVGSMGAAGFSRVPFVPKDLSTLLADCKINSPPGNKWFSGCNPNGLVATINDSFSQNWVVSVASGTSAMTRGQLVKDMGAHLANRELQTPVNVPLYGRGDHWATIWKVDAAFDSGTHAVTDIFSLVLNDAVSIQDGATPPNSAVTQDPVTGDDFAYTDYLKVMSAVGPACRICKAGDPLCVPCDDPFLNKYIYLYDPPPGAKFLADSTSVPAVNFRRAPGLIPAGGRMNSAIASSKVFHAIELANLHLDPTLSERLNQGVAGEAYEVIGRLPEGELRDFYVVPILERDIAPQKALAFVRLDARDGAFQGISTLSSTFVYRPVTSQDAAVQAMTLLETGESLGHPALYWDTTVLHPAARKPWQAFYEFPIENKSATTGEVIRVAQNGGEVLGRAWCGSRSN